MAKGSNRNQQPVQPLRQESTSAVADSLSKASGELTGFFANFFSNFKAQQLIVFFLGFMLYSNSIGLNYAVDDSIVIQRNRFTQRGLAGLHGIFGYDTFFGFFNETKNLVAGGRYRPLSLATFALEVQLFAPILKDAKGDPVRIDEKGAYIAKGQPGYNEAYTCYDVSLNNSLHNISHAINCIMYGLMCWVLYLFLMLLLNPQRATDNWRGTFIAFVATLIYTVHPTHVEAVANIKGRDEIMVLMGSLLCAYWMLKAYYNKEKALIYNIGACVSLFLALMSKENAITFLGIIPISYWAFTNMSFSEIVRKSILILVPIVCFFVIRTYILGQDGNLFNEDSAPIKELMNNPFLKVGDDAKFSPLGNGSTVQYVTNPHKDTYVDMTGSEKMGTMALSWLEYLRLLFLPYDLTNDYYPRHVPDATLSNPKALFAFLLNLGLLAYGAYSLLKRRHNNIIAYGLLFYFATFSIVANFVFPIGTNMSERFMFVPSIGYALIIAYFLWWLANRGGKLSNSKLMPSLVVLFLIIGWYGFQTYARTPYWKDDYTLFIKDINVSTQSAKLTMACAGEVLGNSEKSYAMKEAQIGKIADAATRTSLVNAARKIRLDSVEYAKELLQRSLEIHPGFANAWLLYGNANVYTGKAYSDPENYAKAINGYELALKCYNQVDIWRPGHPDVKQNRGVALRELGQLYGERLGDMANAIRMLEESSKTNPNDSESWRLLGTAYGISGNTLKAIECFEMSLKNYANNIGTLENLGVAYQQLARYEDAEKVLLKSETLIPGNPRTLDLLRRNYSLKGNQAKSNEYAQKITKADPNFMQKQQELEAQRQKQIQQIQQSK